MGEELNEECDLSQHSVSLFDDSQDFMETSLLAPVDASAPSAAAAAASPSAKSSPGAVLAASTSQDPALDSGSNGGQEDVGDNDVMDVDLAPGGVDDDINDPDQDLFTAPLPPPPLSTQETTSTPETDVQTNSTEGRTSLEQADEVTI